MSEEVKKEIAEIQILDGILKADTDKKLLLAATRYMQLSMNNKSLDTPQKVAGAVMYLTQLGMPLSCLPEVAFVHNRYTLYGTAFRSLAQKHPDFGDEKIFEIDKDKKVISIANMNIGSPVFAVVVEIKKKNSEIWNMFYFTMDEAEKAGLVRPNSAWNKYVRDMLQHKAFARAYRASYAAALNGVHMYEDLQDTWEQPKERDVTGQVDLNKVLGGHDDKASESLQEEG